MSEDLLRRALALLPGEGSGLDRVLTSGRVAKVLDVSEETVGQVLHQGYLRGKVAYMLGRETPGGHRTWGWRRT